MGFTGAVITFVMCLIWSMDITDSTSCQWDLNKSHVVYQIGDILELNCTYTGHNANVTNAAILDPHGNKLQLDHVTTNNSIIVTKTITECSQGGTYVCMPNQCGRTLKNVHTIRVEDVSTNPNLTCVFNSYYGALSNITCNWRPNCEDNYYTWALWYTYGTNSAYHQCQVTSDRACVIPEKDSIQYEIYKIRLVQMEYLQPNRTYDYIFYTNQTVWRLEVRINSITSTASDQLNITLNVSDRVRHMICVVQYKSEWTQDLKQVTYTVPYTADLNVEFSLDDLEAFTEYSLSVQCKPNQSLYWSHPTHTVYRTLAAAPNGIPGDILFAEEMTPSGKRQICFYWTPLPKRQLRGNQTEYTITYLEDTGQNVTDFFPPDTVTALLKNTVQSDRGITLRIGSQNEAGMNSMNKQITVRSHNKVSFQIVVIRGLNTSNMTAFWDGQSGHHGQSLLTYYWCEGSIIKGHLPICKSPLLSKTSSNETLAVVTAHHGNKDWYFGASLPTNGNLTPRVVWSNCSFTDTVKDEVQPMEVTLGRHNSSTISVTLDTDYCAFHNMPSTYQVAVTHTDTNCSEGRGFMNYTAVPSLKTLYVTETGRKTAYVCFRMVFRNGQISNSGPFVLDLTNTDTGSRRSSAIITGMAVACGMVLLGLILVGIRFCRVRFKRLTKIEDVAINSPQTDTYDSVYDEDPVIRTDDVGNVQVRAPVVQDTSDHHTDTGIEGVVVYSSVNDQHGLESGILNQNAHPDEDAMLRNISDYSKVLNEGSGNSSSEQDIIRVLVNEQSKEDGAISINKNITETVKPFRSDVKTNQNTVNPLQLDISNGVSISSNSLGNDQTMLMEETDSLRKETDTDIDVQFSNSSTRLTVDNNPSIHSSGIATGSSLNGYSSSVDSYVQPTFESSALSTVSNLDNSQSMNSYVLSANFVNSVDDTRENNRTIAPPVQTNRFNQDMLILTNTRSMDTDPSRISPDSAISSPSAFSFDDYVTSTAP